MPEGVLSQVRWNPSGEMLGFSLSSAKSPSDAYSIDVKNKKLVRWTFSETGGLDPSANVDPELVSMKSFDGTMISAFVYRPDPVKFPGKRPVILNIHGGPEGRRARSSWGAAIISSTRWDWPLSFPTSAGRQATEKHIWPWTTDSTARIR